MSARRSAHPASVSRACASRSISAASTSAGSGCAPGVYHRPKAVPASTCRSYTDTWCGAAATAARTVSAHVVRRSSGSPAIRSSPHDRTPDARTAVSARVTSSAVCARPQPARRERLKAQGGATHARCAGALKRAPFSIAASKDCTPRFTRVTPSAKYAASDASSNVPGMSSQEEGWAERWHCVTKHAGRSTWVHLHGHLRVGRDAERGAQRVQNARQLRRRQQRGRASPKKHGAKRRLAFRGRRRIRGDVGAHGADVFVHSGCGAASLRRTVARGCTGRRTRHRGAARVVAHHLDGKVAVKAAASRASARRRASTRHATHRRRQNGMCT